MRVVMPPYSAQKLNQVDALSELAPGIIVQPGTADTDTHRSLTWYSLGLSPSTSFLSELSATSNPERAGLEVADS